MRFRGRNIDPLKLWGNYVQFPPRMDTNDEFSALVQCPNPEHDTHKRHFQINLRQPTVHCFAHCGISGSYEHAIAMIQGLYERFPDGEREKRRRDYKPGARARRQARKLILRGSISSSRELGHPNSARRNERVGLHDRIPAVDVDSFSRLPELGLTYLERRGISASSIARFEIAWDATERRIVLPAHDHRGRLKFVIKRAVREKDHPKYLYSDESVKSSLLYGACFIDPGMIQSTGLIVVEGSIDCIRLHQHGLACAVATLGTGISRQQVEIIHRLRPKKVILMFDRDLAGVHGIQIAIKRLTKIPMYVARYPKGKDDPAQLTKEEAYRAVSRAMPMRDFKKNLPQPERSFASGKV
jgi:5S rRNA maturation endonuclease (ribonuclease M5)